MVACLTVLSAVKMVNVFHALPLSAQENLFQRVVQSLTVVWTAVRMEPVSHALPLSAQVIWIWVVASLIVVLTAVRMEPVYHALSLSALMSPTRVLASLTAVLTAVRLVLAFLVPHQKCVNWRWILSVLTATPTRRRSKTVKDALCRSPCFMLEVVVT